MMGDIELLFGFKRSNSIHPSIYPSNPSTQAKSHITWADVKPLSTSFSREVDIGRVNPPRKKSTFHGFDYKFLSALANFKKNIVLAFLKATYPQISY
jgi:hypothetical protein